MDEQLKEWLLGEMRKHLKVVLSESSASDGEGGHSTWLTVELHWRNEGETEKTDEVLDSDTLLVERT